MIFSFASWLSTQETTAPYYLSRSIASSDCESMVSEIINPREFKIVSTDKIQHEKVYRLKNTIWNKILSSRDFENFNDNEYFKWLEIYRDANSELSNVNPVSIEQKLAIIEIINSRLLNSKISEDVLTKNFSAEIERLNAYKLKKLQRLISSFDLSSKLTKEQLSDFSSDFVLILKGPPTGLLDYFTKNKSERMNERLMRMIQEDVLIMGLKGVIKRIPEKDQYTKFQNASYLITRFFKHKIGKFFVMPYDLPWVEKVNIPEELLKKILLDGLDAHNSELVAYLKKQNMIDQYERFRKVYKPMAFSISFYFYYNKMNDKLSGSIDQEQEEEKKEFLQEFENLSDSIIEANKKPLKTEQDLKEEQFDRILKSYRDEYKSEPSEEEIKELRLKIFK